MKNARQLKALTLTISLALGLSAINVTAAETYDTDTYTDTSWQTQEAAEFSRLDTSGNGFSNALRSNEGQSI